MEERTRRDPETVWTVILVLVAIVICFGFCWAYLITDAKVYMIRENYIGVAIIFNIVAAIASFWLSCIFVGIAYGDN